jgi:hypothetical protein
LIILSNPSPKTGKGGAMVLSGADAVLVDRAARDFRTPDQIEWER